MLKKLDYYYDEYHDKIYISNDKIYWDTVKNQFRHKFECGDCGEPLGCYCFDELAVAIYQVGEGITCENCCISYIVDVMSIDELMSEMDSDRQEKIIAFAESLITKEDIEKFIEESGCSGLEFCDKLEIIEESDNENKLKDFVVNLLTDDEKRAIMIDTCDFAEGESCNF